MRLPTLCLPSPGLGLLGRGLAIGAATVFFTGAASATLEVAAGRRDVSLAVGVDKTGDQIRAVQKEKVSR